MAKHKSDVSKSEEIRQLLRAQPKMPVSEVRAALAQRGIKVSSNLIYFVKGRAKGRRKRAKQVVAKVSATSNGNPVAMIRKVKSWANEVGGIKMLKALVDALAE